ncbi:MAG: hypothetical protein JNK32_01020 [Anaerolineales bacterium]|nr:hypothetical protein [Anaerolineales bacterium]
MKFRRYLTIYMILLSALACVIPGMSQPAPVDPALLPTIVVLTVDAAMTQTAVAGAPVGQVPANEPLPTATSEAAVTTLEVLPDGGTKFTHVNGGYEVTYPTGWLTVRPNSEEFNAAHSKDAAKNPLLLGQMDYDANAYEAGFDQLFSYALRPDIDKNFLFGFSTVSWDTQDTLPLNEAAMGELARELETSGAIPGFRVDTAQIYETSKHRIKVIEIGGQFSLSDGQDGVIPFYMTAVFFKPTADTFTRITFTYLKDYKVQLSLDVSDTIVSIKLLGQ